MAALRMAFDMRIGSRACAIAEFSNTPSAPNSNATDTSLAVPTPASTITDNRIAFFQVLENDPQVVGIQDALATTNRTTGWHDTGSTGGLQLSRDDRIIARITQYLKTIRHQFLTSRQRGHRIGQQGLGIASTSNLTQSAPGFSSVRSISRPCGPREWHRARCNIQPYWARADTSEDR